MTTHLDVITLKGLRAEGIHGVLDHEKDTPQPFIVDLCLWVDASAAHSSDDISDTVSYARVADDVVAVITGPSVRLIETLAARIADSIHAIDGVVGVEVTVHKPQAPLGHEFGDVSVSTARGAVPHRVVLAAHELTPISTQLVDADAAQDGPTMGATSLPAAGRKSNQGWADLGIGVDEDGDSAAAADAPAAEAPSITDSAVAPAGEDEAAGAPALVDSARPRSRAQEQAERRAAENSAAAPRGISRVVLSLGGNVGDVPSTLRDVIESLIDTPEVSILDISPILRTKPVLDSNQAPQDDYWNAVVIINTTFTPQELLSLTAFLEGTHGRARTEKWAPRTVDIDIIEYEGVILNTPELTLPHPRAHERAFVLVPWGLIDEDAVLPGHGRIADLFMDAPDLEGIVDGAEEWLIDPASVMGISDARLNAEYRHAAATPRSDTPVAADKTPGDAGIAENSGVGAAPEEGAAQDIDQGGLAPEDTAPEAEAPAAPPQPAPAPTRESVRRSRRRQGAAERAAHNLDQLPGSEGGAPASSMNPSGHGAAAPITANPPVDTSVRGGYHADSVTDTQIRPPILPQEMAASQGQWGHAEGSGESADGYSSRAESWPRQWGKSSYETDEGGRPSATYAALTGAIPTLARPVTGGQATPGAYDPTYDQPTEPEPAQGRAPTPAEQIRFGQSGPAPTWHVQRDPAQGAQGAQGAPAQEHAGHGDQPYNARQYDQHGVSANYQGSHYVGGQQGPGSPSGQGRTFPQQAMGGPTQGAASPSGHDAGGGHNASQWHAGDSEEPAQGEGPWYDSSAAQGNHHSRHPLPDWRFSTGEVRILDTVVVQTPPRTAIVDSSRTVLEPNLPEGTPVGALDPTEDSATTVLRNMTVRPTVTGQVPVPRRGNERR
ncbi:MAG: 2-amino-4-hydroxy-6-hydroxymethyldihydropteridine diphosphokinase [Actinomycetaceae bacterium]|nr:2-amino-4-hydroxy-6-hydroxymethyldihydropteridine diphosphokinase [Actinomycetaceae bacterium]